MKIVFRYLRPFALIVLLCLVLLFGQALCDLSLPNLMSDIVNVGIQQNGIEEAAPERISENGMELVSLFMPPAERADFAAGYTFSQAEGCYIRNDADKTRRATLSGEYGQAALALMNYLKSMMAQQGVTADSSDTDAMFENMDITQLYAMLPLLESLPAGSFDAAIAEAAAADPLMHEQVGVVVTELFYKELGMDVAAIQRGYILKTGGMMLLVTLAGALATIGVGFFASRVGAAVARKMRHDVFQKVGSFSSAEFNQFSTASLITRTTNDVQQVQMLITMGIRMVCYAPIMGIGGTIMAVGKSVSLSWVIAAAVVVLLGLILVLFAVAMPKFKSLQKLIDRLNLVSRENLSGMMVIRAFSNEKHEEDRFEKANRNLRDTNLFVQRAMATMMPAMMLIMNGLSLVIVWVGGHAIAESTLQVGDMMAFIQYAMQIIMAFLMIAMMFIMVPRAAVSGTRIAEVLDTRPIIRDPEPAKLRTLGRAKGEVEFHDVSFHYDKAETNVLDDINFVAKPGQTTAFIGSTGSGKSTLINLIPRFYDVTGGYITIDGIDIRNLSQKELRDNIGYVPQKGILFSGDIASNIRYGKEDAAVEEIQRAIEVAQAKDFVDATEEGIETPIAQGGTNVSGGQKQRLSIARALVKNPPIYIFDDSFSALDFKTDAALRKALKSYTADATVLIVAQRVSTILHAEQIVVLDKGRIVGIGTHSELLKTCAEYREIAESQLTKEELA